MALVLATIVVAWVVVAALWTTFRVVELALVAAAAGWLGWRLGVWHGRRLGRANQARDPGCTVLDARLQAYPNQVRLVQRHFPLKSHIHSRLSAEAI